MKGPLATFPGIGHDAPMDDSHAFKLATEMLAKFIEHQDIPPGGTSGTAKEHGEKTAQFLVAMHRTLFDYFKQHDKS
jgi:hypothetical protein